MRDFYPRGYSINITCWQGRAGFPNGSLRTFHCSQTLFRESLVPRKWRLCLLQFRVSSGLPTQGFTLSPSSPLSVYFWAGPSPAGTSVPASRATRRFWGHQPKLNLPSAKSWAVTISALYFQMCPIKHIQCLLLHFSWCVSYVWILCSHQECGSPGQWLHHMGFLVWPQGVRYRTWYSVVSQFILTFKEKVTQSCPYMGYIGSQSSLFFVRPCLTKYCD